MQFRTFMRHAALAAAFLLVPGHAQSQESHDASRVVAIGGSVTEIIYALGEEGRLIARDTTSIYPEAALALPDVGYMRALSPEGVLSVDPTLILAVEGSGPPEAIEVLEKASVAMVAVPESYDGDGIIEKIRIVGETLGVADKAEALAEKVAADLDRAGRATADIDDRARVLFVLSLQGGRVLGSGTGTAANGAIVMAGGVNAITEFQGYKQLSDEAVIGAAPDFVLVMHRGGDHAAGIDQVLSHPAIAATPAGQAGRVIRMDGAYLLGFGPRTADAVHDLSVALYGDAVSGD